MIQSNKYDTVSEVIADVKPIHENTWRIHKNGFLSFSKCKTDTIEQEGMPSFFATKI
jgi:hypothetical protein